MKRMFAAAVSAALAIAGVVGVAAPSEAAAGAGRLESIIVTPKGVPANVVLDGPSHVVLVKGASGVVQKSVVSLSAGTYQVNIPAVTVNGVRYVGATSPQTLRVQGGRTAALAAALVPEPGARNLSAKNVTQAGVTLTWEAPTKMQLALRRATGGVPPSSPTSGTRVPTAVGTSTDQSLSASTTYSYSLFTRIGSHWYGPQTLQVRTAAPSGTAQASYVAQPTTVFASAPDVSQVTTSNGGLNVTFARGVTTPVVGVAVVIAPTVQLAGGYIGVVSSVSESGVVALTPGGLGDALQSYSLSVPAFSSDPASTSTTDTTTAAPEQAVAGRYSRLSQALLAHGLAAGTQAATAPGSPLTCDSSGDARINSSLGISGSFHFESDNTKQKATVDMSLVASGDAVLGGTVTGKASCSVNLPKLTYSIPVPGFIVPIGVALTPVAEATISGKASFTGIGGHLETGFRMHGDMAIQNGQIPMSQTSSPIKKFARDTPSVNARVDVDMKLGGNLLVGPGIASNVAGAILGVEGSLGIVDGHFALAASDTTSGVASCLRISADFTAGLYLVARAWLNIPVVGFDLSARVKLAALDTPIPYFDPVTSPTGCDPDAPATTPPPEDTPPPSPTAGGGPIVDPALKACAIAEYTSETGVTPPDLSAEQLATLQNLACASGDVASLEGLQYATSLQSLMITQTSPTPRLDLSTISKLPALTSLSISGSITGLNALQGNTSLQSLSLTNGDLSTLAVVPSMTSLVNVRFDSNHISDISPLETESERGGVYSILNQKLTFTGARVGIPYTLPAVAGFSGGNVVLNLAASYGALTHNGDDSWSALFALGAGGTPSYSATVSWNTVFLRGTYSGQLIGTISP